MSLDLAISKSNYSILYLTLSLTQFDILNQAKHSTDCPSRNGHGFVGSAHSMLNSLGLTHCALFTVLDFSLAAIAYYSRVETKTLQTKSEVTERNR